MSYVKLRNINIYYEMPNYDSLNDHRSVLFLFPGGPGCNHGIYKTHSREFEAITPVVYFDPRGCGLSDQSDFIR